MKRNNKKNRTNNETEPKAPSIYRRDPATDLWKGEDGCMYRLDTHGTKPPHLDLKKAE